MNFNFGEVLTKAWQIIWKYKILWVFGILASCGRGGGGNGGGSGGNNYQNARANLSPQAMQFFQWIQENMTTFIVIGIAIICIIWILAVFLSTIGKIGLIHGTAQVDGGVESLVFGQLFSESMLYFWRMFGLSLIVAIPVVVLVGAFFAGIIVLAISAGGGNDAGLFALLGSVPILIGCMCLFVPIMFVIGMIIRQAQSAIVLEDLDILPALSRGWDVFRTHLGPVLIMAIILAIIGFVAGMIIAVPVFLVVFPTVLAFIAGQGQSYMPLVFMGVCLCIYIPLAMVLQGVLTSYTESAWTLTYLRLTRKPEEGSQPKPGDQHPIEPEDNNRTILASRPNV